MITGNPNAVVIRKENDGHLIAVFPYRLHNRTQSGMLVSVTQGGEHVSAEWNYIRWNTHPADPQQTKRMLGILDALGYANLKCLKKLPPIQKCSPRR